MRSSGHRHAVLAGAMFASAALVGAAGFATAEGKSRAQQAPSPLLGAWRVISVENVRTDGTVNTDWMGAKPVGLIVYDASGWMSVQLGRDPRHTWQAARVSDAKPEDKAKAFEAHYAYFGRYEVDEKAGIVQHHIERSLWPTESGITYRRFFRLEGERLTLRTPPLEDGSHNALVWERVRPGGS